MEVGDRIGRYELLRLLGKGGAGSVFLASDRETVRLVALKTLHPDLASQKENRERFAREAQIVRSIYHPNVAQCLDMGEIEGLPYIVFEYVSGVSLEQLVERREPLDPRAVLSIWQDVCFALYAVHKAGIVHRDVKPHNVLITGENVVKLIDFGIATGQTQSPTRLTPPDGRLIQGMNRITPSDHRMGTPFFSAPELLAGEAPTASADVYALGLIVVELLLGSPVYEVNRSGDLISAQLDLPDSLFEPTRRIPELSPELDGVLSRMLAFRRDDRYPSALELFRALETFLPTAPSSEEDWTEALRDSKEAARVEITEACYWTGASLSSEGRYVEALLEYEQLLSVQSRRVELYRGKLVSELRFLLWKLQVDEQGDDPRSSGNMLLTLAATARLLDRLDDPFGLIVVNRRAARWIRQRATAQERIDAAQALCAMGPFEAAPFVTEILLENCKDPREREELCAELEAIRSKGCLRADDEAAEAGVAELLDLHGSTRDRDAQAGLMADTRSFLSIKGQDARLWESMANIHDSRNEGREADLCWKEAAFLRLRHGEDEAAAHDLKKILDDAPEDREGLLGLFELVSDERLLPPFSTFHEGAKLILLAANMGKQAFKLLRKVHGSSPRARERYQNFILRAEEMNVAIALEEVYWDLALLAWNDGDETEAKRNLQLAWDHQHWPKEERRARISHPAMKYLFDAMYLARLAG